MIALWLTAALAGDYDLDLSSFDLGEGAAATTAVYKGGIAQATGGVAPDVKVAVNHPGGTVRLRCTDGDTVRANLDYAVEGKTEAPAKQFGDGLKLGVSGSGASAAVSVVVPSRSSSIVSVKADLTVTVPKNAVVTVDGRSDWVQVVGCGGFVTARAGANGVYVEGPLTGFAVAAAKGNAEVVLREGAVLSKASALTASAGDAKLTLPGPMDFRLDARGASMSVLPSVEGRLDATTAAGNVGAGGQTVTVRASGGVEVTAP